MIRWFTVLLAGLALGPVALCARGGGGCLAAGTRIATPHGDVAIESVRVGDTVWGLVAGQRVPARVEEVYAVEPLEYVELVTGDGVGLCATPEHPVQVAVGTFVRADHLRASASLFRASTRVPLAKVRRLRADRPAFNLFVAPGGVFFANGLLVHNKGCFLPDTPVLLADGSRKAICEVQAGMTVLAFDEHGRTLPARVAAVFKHQVGSYLVVRTAQVELHVTEEHPFYVGAGGFKTVAALRVGDLIWAHDGSGRLRPQPLLALERVQAPVTVYNLQTDEPHTFLADGIAVHNKGGGCFAAGTLVTTPCGPRAIETLALGDAVLAPAEDGSLVPATVQGIHLNFTRLLTLHTDRGHLRTTPEHPLLDGAGSRFRAAADFARGDRIAHVDGAARIDVVETGWGNTPVFNLSISAPHTFLADGFVAHNKGGGGFRFRSSVGSSTEPANSIIIAIWLLGFLGLLIWWVYSIIKHVRRRRGRKRRELDHCFKPTRIARKADKTRKLLAFIGKIDGLWEEERLRRTVETTFLQLQQCWVAREYAPMEPLLMCDLYEQHCAQLRGMRQTHEVNHLDDLKVHAVDIVRLRYTEKKEQRTFTALITAAARDYYVDDGTQKFIRGDKEVARFQEFWTFQLVDGAFRLREIEQSQESDALTEDDFFEQMTDVAREQIYGKTAGATGPAGPTLPTAVQEKGTKIERLLNFLVQTDRIWNRDEMLATARRTYLSVLLGWQDGRPGAFAGAPLSPAIAAHLQGVNESNQRRGWSVEYRNFCVRKVEIVYVDNRDDRKLDAFTVRISAHAQTIMKRGGCQRRHDEDVMAWVEFWTFSRDGQRWVLREILPDAQGEAALARENVDEGTDQQMLEWYYSKARAT